jgi:hypothetical protein
LFGTALWQLLAESILPDCFLANSQHLGRLHVRQALALCQFGDGLTAFL